MDNQEIVIYISNGSTYCNKVIRLMDKHHVSYKVKNVTQNHKYMREMQEFGIYGTPALFIKGQEQPILGYQKKRILKALNISEK